MILQDRELLVRLRKLNQGLPNAVVELLNYVDGGQLPSAGLRAIAHELHTLANDLAARADVIDDVDGVPPTIIDSAED